MKMDDILSDQKKLITLVNLKDDTWQPRKTR